uniref:Syntaxin-1A-like n=1 Tax=Hirondellea gigas TaxID=1518452 RepID=A0A2R5L0N7_9CRUS
MCRDRLPEFQSKAGLPLEIVIEINYPNGNSSMQSSNQQGVNPEELFKLLDPLGLLYTDIKSLQQDVAQLRAGINQHVNKDKFEDQIVEVKRKAHAIRKGIDQFKQEFENSEDHLLSHIARTHHLSLIVWSRDSLDQLSSLLIDAHHRHKAYIKKELLITSDNNITEEELEALLLDKPPAVFTQDLLQETNVAKQTLYEIRERHDQVVKIEKSIVELNHMFQDLATLVRTQGESIDRIENQMFEASERTSQAREQMKEACVKSQSARKKKYILYAILTSVVIVFIVLIIYSFQ